MSERLYATRRADAVKVGDSIMHYHEGKEVVIDRVRPAMGADSLVAAGFAWPAWSRFHGSRGTCVWRPGERVWVYVREDGATNDVRSLQG